MSLDSNRPPRRGPEQDLWPKWMWVAVPVLVVVVVAGLWWAIFSPSPEPPTAAPTPTMPLVPTQPTQGPTPQATLAITAEETRPVLPQPATFTPAPGELVATPTGEVAAESEELSIGSNATVVGTGAVGLNMRAGAGTGHARVKTLADGSPVEIIGGPRTANNLTWWQVRDAAGTTGWAAAQFLSPGTE
jgi:hypothetical protein